MPRYQPRINRPQETAIQGNATTAQLAAKTAKDTEASPGAELMNLQRSLGNRAVGHMMGSGMAIQTKLTVGPVGDAYEQEADQMGKMAADHISAIDAGGAGAQAVQRMGGEDGGLEVEGEELQMKRSETIQRVGEEDGLEVEGEELQMKRSETIQRMGEEDGLEVEGEELQMKRSETIQRMGEEDGLEVEGEELQMKSSADGFEAAPSIEAEVKAQQGAGSKMDATIQAKMESAFGADFSSVNIHTDTKANELNKSLGAEAFATGNDIFFREGQYNPESRQGQELLGHELTHVIQQNGG